MKKTGLLLLLCMTAAAVGQQADPNPANQSTPEGTVPTSVSFPVERVQTPTSSDLYCAGFVNKQVLPNSNFVLGGLESPNTTKFVNNDLIYLAGHGYQAGQQYTIVRELRDANRYEIFAGQHSMVDAMGQPYAELARSVSRTSRDTRSFRGGRHRASTLRITREHRRARPQQSARPHKLASAFARSGQATVRSESTRSSTNSIHRGSQKNAPGAAEV